MMNNEGPPHSQRNFGFRVNILTFLEEILLIRSFSIFHEKQSIEERFSDIKNVCSLFSEYRHSVNMK